MNKLEHDFYKQFIDKRFEFLRKPIWPNLLKKTNKLNHISKNSCSYFRHIPHYSSYYIYDDFNINNTPLLIKMNEQLDKPIWPYLLKTESLRLYKMSK